MNQQKQKKNRATSRPDPEKKTTSRGSSSDRIRIGSLLIPFVLVLVLTMFSGIVPGVMDGRWSIPADLIARGSRLEELPEKIGDWSLVEHRELEEKAAEMLRCYGSEVRVYRHAPSDSTITVAIIFGPRGPTAVHTPEICFSSVGTKQFEKRKAETIGDDQFWSVQFMEKSSPEPTLDVWYGWSDGSNWVASEYPRFWMTENLYKIQIAGPVGFSSFRPCNDFMETFLPDIALLIEE